MKKLAPPFLVLVFTLTFSPVSSAGAEEAPFDARDVSWNRLEFTARKFLFSAKTEVRLRPVATSEAAAEWVQSPQGKAVEAAGPEVMEVTIESTGFGVSTNRVWFNPARADALQRSKLKPKSYRKAGRFLEDGVFVLRSSPVDKVEAGGPPAQWTKLQQYSYPRPRGGCPVVSEPSVLFYMLSARKGDKPFRICVFSNKKIIPISIETAGTEQVRVDYQQTRESSSSAEHRKGSVQALRLTVRPVDGGDGELELMGLKGDVEILLDKTLRIPLEVRGDTDVGSVKAKLTAVELRTDYMGTSIN